MQRLRAQKGVSKPIRTSTTTITTTMATTTTTTMLTASMTPSINLSAKEIFLQRVKERYFTKRAENRPETTSSPMYNPRKLQYEPYRMLRNRLSTEAEPTTTTSQVETTTRIVENNFKHSA